MEILNAALDYHRAGLAVWPANPEQKRPAGDWGGKNPKVLDEAALKSWGRVLRGLCILCGKVSGGVECIDFDDKGSAFSGWQEAVRAAHPELLARLVMERSPSGGVHVVYRCPEAERPKTSQLAFAPDDGRLLIETRGDGAVFLCDPSPGYKLFQGAFTAVPTITLAERDALIALAAARGAPKKTPTASRPPVAYVPVPAGEMHPYIAKALADEAAEVASCPEGGRNHRLNKAAFKLGHYVGGGVLSEDLARSELTRAALAAGLGAHETALSITSGLAAGIRDPKGVPEASLDDGGVNMDGLAAHARRVARGPVVEVIDREEDDDEDLPDAGGTVAGRLEPMPHDLLDAPGFIHDVVEWGMAANLYPNRPLIFASTLATLATLTARKITLAGRTCPNVYTLAVAPSGTGKDAGNKLAAPILRHADMGHCAQYDFSSSEAIEDALCDISPTILWLCDEIDAWLGSTKNDASRGGLGEGKVSRMLKLFSQSNEVIQRRIKARTQGGRKKLDPTDLEMIHMPHLSLYGTCTPKGFFSAFNERIAAGGILGRMLIFDADPRGFRQRPTASLAQPPDSVIEVARYWANRPCGPGEPAINAAMPQPLAVPFGPGAEDLDENRAHLIDGELFPKFERTNDPIGSSIYARTAEYANKSALLYAASANPFNPVACINAVNWGWNLSMWQSKRLVDLFGQHAADNPFQELCLKITNRLRAERGEPVGRYELLRLTRAKKADFDAAIDTLVERREIAPASIRTKTKSADGYRLRVRRIITP